MQITGVRSRLIEMPLDGPFRPAWGRGRVQSSLQFVLFEVGTDDGLVGLGAANEGLATADAIDRYVTPAFLGQDPTEIERLAGVIRDAEILGPPPYVMEIPLWDLLGKAAGLPVFRLWGGAATPIRAYCSTGELRSPEARADDARRILEAGFTAMKLRFHNADVRDDLAVVQAVRDEVGDALEIMVDANQAGADPGLGGHSVWDFQTALAVARELERLGAYWLEEPLPRHDHTGLARLHDRLEGLRLAGGEDNHGLHEFHQLLHRGCFDILQPDAMKSATASAIRKLAAFAELSGVGIVPHTWGQGMGLLVHLHLAASLGCPYVEFPHDPPSGLTAQARDQMLAQTLTIDEHGCLRLPERPGVGFVLDEDRIDRHTQHVIERGDFAFHEATGGRGPKRSGTYQTAAWRVSH